jgi:hypothetical protein
MLKRVCGACIDVSDNGGGIPGITLPRVQSGLVEGNKTEIAPMSSAASVFRSCLAASERALGNSAPQRLGEANRDVASYLYDSISIQNIRLTLCGRRWKYLGDS